MDKRLNEWCDQVIGEVRFWIDHNKIRTELEDHIEDRCGALEELNYPPELAAERTLAAMGDPVEIGRALDKEHSPWLGWLWVASVSVLAVLCIMLAVEAQSWGRKIGDGWERIMETVSPTPYEQLWREVDENYDFSALHGLDYTCIGVSGADPADAGMWTVEIPKAVWWDRFGKFTYVGLVLNVTPEKPWYGTAWESPEELIITVNGEEAVNLSARKHVGLGGSGFPHFSVHDERQSLLCREYLIGITFKGEAEQVEISWPYGDAPWTIVVERGAVS